MAMRNNAKFTCGFQGRGAFIRQGAFVREGRLIQTCQLRGALIR